MSRVFVLNAGSSSLKYRLIDLDSGRALAWGLAEGIGTGGRLVHHDEQGAHAVERSLPDHATAVAAVLAACPLGGVAAVAHRVVHGGERFRVPVVVDDGVLADIRALSVLAPLHNPAGVAGIELARRALPAVPHVAVFDTAFHHTLPARAHTYAVPRGWGAHSRTPTSSCCTWATARARRRSPAAAASTPPWA